MAYTAKQLRRMVVQILKYMDPMIPYSDDAVELLMLTAAAETHGGNYNLYRVDLDNRNGIFQMKPDTLSWLSCKMAAKYGPEYSRLVGGVLAAGFTAEQNLDLNVLFQIFMARCYYTVFPEPIPALEDYRIKDLYYKALGAYWKVYWNTDDGDGSAYLAYTDYKRYGRVLFPDSN